MGSEFKLTPEELSEVAQNHRRMMKYNAMPIEPIKLTPVSDDDLVARVEQLADTLIRKRGEKVAEELFVGAFQAAKSRRDE